MNKDSLPKRIVIHIILIIAVVIAVYPALRVFSISLRPINALHTTDLRIIPEGASFKSYYDVLFNTEFPKWFLNSSLVALITTLIGISVASTAGYAFSRFKFMGRKPLLMFFLVTQMFPVTMLILPLYLMLARMGLINSYLGLIIMYTTTALPLCVWQMKGFYDTIPYSLEEAGLIDGLSHWGCFIKIAFPLARPGLVISGLFSFMAAWTDFIVARVIMHKEELWTLPLGIQHMSGEFDTQWGMFAASSILVAIPVVIVFIFLARFLVSGLSLGGVKS
ncbi:sugar ABC transporter permease [Halothermothrix orenii]|uniref:Binding-protein-dependent transport systems inner membrane component n=1 Tax=Halothermothrix orenii (strain H 168 / OCM 544 / DSM 9562) TaxID=373903 RepID=B8CZT8_HALOH|nr:sugar ABC transporter permease [Halothermothrix orenii]ACL70790.1 binding-protein-dependent transport systems inner membrane component [Halothermothrix orenii H 168]